MLHNSLVVINNGLAFAYVNMHSLVQKVMEGPGDWRIFWWNVRAAKLRCWLISHPGRVLQVCPGSDPPSGRCNHYIQSVFVSLHYMMYLFTSENQALFFFIFYFLQRGEEYLLHFPPSVKGAYSILSIHSIRADCSCYC